MKSTSLYILSVIFGSFFCLFIPLWFLPFLFSLINAYYFGFINRRLQILPFIVYFVLCFMFGLYTYSTGSKELISMIGDIFNGLGFIPLLLFSGLLFGLTAQLGAWLGLSLRQYLKLPNT